MATNFAKNMQRLRSAQSSSLDNALGRLPAPARNTVSAAPSRANAGGGDPLFNALREIQRQNPTPPKSDHWATRIPIIGGLAEAVTNPANENFGDRAKSALGWITNDYVPTATALKVLGTTGAFTAGGINEVITPDKTPGEGFLDAAGRNVQNLWSKDPNRDPVVYNQDWIKNLYERDGKEYEDAPLWARGLMGAGGFVADVATDPLSYIGAGTLSRVAEGGNRAASAGARVAGREGLAARTAAKADAIRTRRNTGVALRHDRRKIMDRAAQAGERVEQRLLKKPVTPGTRKADEIVNDVAEDTITAANVANNTHLPIPKAPKPHQTAPQDIDSALSDALADIAPTKTSPAVAKAAEAAVEEPTQDALFEALERIKPTAISEAATPKKRRADIPDLPSPFRNMAAGVGDFVQPNLLDEIPPARVFEPHRIGDFEVPAPPKTSSGRVKASDVVSWYRDLPSNLFDALPRINIFGKQVSAARARGILSGTIKPGALNAGTGKKLTPEQLRQVPAEIARQVKPLYDDAARGSVRPAAGTAAPDAGDVPLTAPDAPTGQAAPDSGTSAWREVPGMDGWETMGRRQWDNLHKRLKRLMNNKKISAEDYRTLVRAKKENNPSLWREKMDEIMYEGFPTPIDGNLRRLADELPNTDAIENAAVAGVGSKSPTMRLVNDPLDEFDEASAIREAITQTLRDEFIKKPQTHTIPTKTAAKLKVDGDIADPTVTGRYAEGMGRFSQYTLFKNLLKGLEPQMRDIRAMRRADGRANFSEQGLARYELVMPRLKASLDALEMQNVVPNMSAGIVGYPVHIHDVLSSLSVNDAVRMAFHPNSDVPVTNIMEAMELAIKNTDMPEAEMLEFMADILKKAPSGRGGGVNRFANFGDLSDKAARARLKIYQTRKRNPKITWQQMVNEEAALHARALYNQRANLRALAIEKTARYNATISAEFTTITRETVDKALENIDSGTYSTLVNTIENLEDLTVNEANKIGAASESIERAIPAVEAEIAAKVAPEIIADANDAAAKVAAVESGDLARISETAQKVSDDAVARAQEKAPAATLTDHEAANTLALEARTNSVWGWFKSRFQKNYQMETVGNAVSMMRTVARPMRAEYRNALNNAAKKWAAKVSEQDSRTLFDAAFYELQAGRTVQQIANPRISGAAAEVQELVDFFFSTSGVASDDVFNRFVMNGLDLDVINNMFAKRGLDNVAFDRKAAEAAVKAGQFDNVGQALGAQWKNWTISDPAEFLSIAEHTLNHIATVDATVRQGIYLARSHNLVSSKPRPGYVPFRSSQDLGIGDLSIQNFFPPNTYMDKRIVSEFQRMEKVLNENLAPNGPLGKWLGNWALPLMNMWKTGMTIWNPRHWMRNGIGDLSANFLAGVSDPNAYVRAMRIMNAKSSYNGMWDGAEALRIAGTELRGKPYSPVRNANATVVQSKNGLKFSSDDIYFGLRDRGALVSHPVRNDLLDDMIDPTRMNQFQDKVAITGGRAKQVVSNLHEWRDHYIRIGHAVDVVAKGSFKTKEEAIDTAAALVRKWHPDGSDLSTFESKYMRILAPFYSWTRRALPLVAESLISNPQRIMAYPKAYYNFAESMGVDLNSLADPFPVDQMFPSYMTDRITGPLHQNEDGEYIGYHPGVIQDDLSGWMNDPLKEALGMLSPLIKVPVELATGTRIGTQADIRDTSDYVDSSIPFVNTIANVTGISPTGTLYNAATGNQFNEQPYGSTLDRQANIERGLKEHGDMNALFNWLSGLQRTNMSAPNAITRAEFEERERLERQAQQEQFRRMRNDG